MTNDKAMQSTEPGFGQIYLASYRDSDNDGAGIDCDVQDCGPDDVIFVAGSLYVAGAARDAYPELLAQR